MYLNYLLNTPFSTFERVYRNYVDRYHQQPAENIRGPIGLWVYKLRRAYHNNQLNENSIAKIEALPKWSWSVMSLEDNEFDKGMKAYEVYVTYHHQPPLPHTVCSLPDGKQFAVGQWLIKQRQAYLDSNLTPFCIAELEALPKWSWDISSFETHIIAYLGYVKKYQQAPPNNSTFTLESGETVPIGKWIRNQRKEYHYKKLSASRIAQLETLPKWSWTLYLGDFIGELETLRWAVNENEKNITAYLGYVEKYQQAPPNNSTFTLKSGETVPIGKWVHNQRQAYHGEKLNASRIAQLETLPKWSWTIQDTSNLISKLEKYQVNGGLTLDQLGRLSNLVHNEYKRLKPKGLF